ncbi:hypothetical protein WBG99_33750 [Streptomyces sp. TG1A-60]
MAASAAQQSSPGTCSSSTRRSSAARTVGTSPGSIRANAAMTEASSEEK